MQQATSRLTISIAVEIHSTPENEVVLPGVDRCLCRGLSRMLLKAHVRFLGGSSAAMRCCYPTRPPCHQASHPTDAGLQEFSLCTHHSWRQRVHAHDRQRPDEGRGHRANSRPTVLLFGRMSSPHHIDICLTRLPYRDKTRSTGLGYMASASRTSWVNISGRVGILCPRWDETSS